MEVPKFLLRQASKLLSLQHKPFHAVQVLVPLLHQLLSLERKETEGGGSSLKEPPPPPLKGVKDPEQPRLSCYLCEGHGRLPGEEESCEVSFHLVFLLRVFFHLGENTEERLLRCRPDNEQLNV